MLTAVIWIITVISVVSFVSRRWWFPESASAHGSSLDDQFMITLIVTGVVFVAAQIGLGYIVLRYKEKKNRTAEYSHGNNTMELIWTLATTVVFFIMVLMGQGTWYDLYIGQASDSAVQIEVTGQQFAWNIRYPGPDGKFGTIRPELINDSGGNPLGLDLKDAAAQDDIVVPTMAIPVNRPIQLLLRSKDVTHAFSVRELRVKQDTVPGLVIPLQFTATKIGKFELACAELCGMGHHRMRSFVNVLKQEDYEQWLLENSEF